MAFRRGAAAAPAAALLSNYPVDAADRRQKNLVITWPCTPLQGLLREPVRLQVACLVELLLSPWLRPVAAGGFRGLMESFVESVADVMREDGDDVGGGRATRLALLDVQDSTIKFAADVSQQLQAAAGAAVAAPA